MKTMLILLFVFLIFFFIVGVLYDRRKAQSKKVHDEWLNEIPHDYVISSYSLSDALLLNDSSETLIFLQDLDQDEYEYEEITFKEILEVSLIEDHQVLYAFPKNGVLGTEGIGKGESEESDEEEDHVEHLVLKILVDDLSQPLKVFTCIDEDDYLLKDSDEYVDAFEDCVDWYHKLVVIIKRSEKNRAPIRPS